MLEQFKDLEYKYADIERKMSDPEVISDRKQYQDVLRQHSELKEMVETYRDYEKVCRECEESEELLSDPEMAEMAKEEYDRLSVQKVQLEEKLQFLLIPKDPDDHKNAIVEIRSGTGGDEAALFAEDLFRMYSRYADKIGWKV
ncbi:peptide chain release factor 1, partial [Candidatus Marinamargulisbacteria bacterium SCGC AG-439-L15]